MYLFMGLVIGTLYGRNAETVNKKAYEDALAVWRVFAKTQLAFNLYILADAIYERIVRLREREVIYIHDMLCTCNKRNCLGYSPSINTYVRKLKATN